VVGWLARATGAANLVEVGARLHRDPTTLSRIVSRIDRESTASPPLAVALERLKSALTQA
jgi:hypothetical protein